MYQSRLNTEWETTISISLDESEYLKVLQQSHAIDVIFLFKNGMRLSNRSVQKKTTLSCRRLLNYYNNTWIALERTTATEEDILPTTLHVEKYINRLIVHQKKGLRVSYNKEVCITGEKFNIEFEIEYPPTSTYEEILIYERRLMKAFLKQTHRTKLSTMTRIGMFSCVMSKVQMWHCFDKNQPYIWAYKWNGIKSKILITGTATEDGSLITYTWSDSSEIQNKKCRGTNIDQLINICCAVEEMDDRFVIIEAIGTLVNDEIFTTEPMANASFLRRFSEILGNDMFIDDKPVVVQTFNQPPLPDTYGENYDGFIIIQNDIIIKWKIPTTDVKCITPTTYKIGSQQIQLDFIGEPGKIYEITHKYEVLRKRNDRSAASSDQEYQIFLQSKLLLEQIE